jgi:hypothetical protein
MICSGRPVNAGLARWIRRLYRHSPVVRRRAERLIGNRPGPLGGTAGVVTVGAADAGLNRLTARTRMVSPRAHRLTSSMSRRTGAGGPPVSVRSTTRTACSGYVGSGCPCRRNHRETGNASIGCEQWRSGQSCPSQRSAEPSVKIGAVGTVDMWMAGETSMVIPTCAVLTGVFGASCCSARRRWPADLVPNWLGYQHHRRYTARAHRAVAPRGLNNSTRSAGQDLRR